jgi:hypothetical protein
MACPKDFNSVVTDKKSAPLPVLFRTHDRQAEPEVRAVSLPFAIVWMESNRHDNELCCARVSTKLAAICWFTGRKSSLGKDNPIAHHVQYFSHLLN